MAAKTLPSVLPFNGRRVRYESKRTFDGLLADLRTAVGVATRDELGECVAKSAGQSDFEFRMQRIAGPSGFMLFFEMDHGAWLKVYGVHRKTVRWVFGNPVIAYTMLRHDIAAGLFAPVELLLFENGVGSTVMYDLPSSLMVIDDNPPLLDAARTLDRKFAELIEGVV